MSGGLYSGTHPFDGHPHVKPLAANEKTQTPKGPLPKSEGLPHAVARMRRQGYNDRQIAGQISKWHPNYTPRHVSQVLQHAPRALPGQNLGAMFEGLPRDYGMNPAGIHKASSGKYVDQTGKPLRHQPAPAVKNEHVGDVLGVVGAANAIGQFAKHPSISTGVGAGLGAMGLIPPLRGGGEAGRLVEGAIEKEAAKGIPEEAAAVKAGMRGAKVARRKQDVLHSEERSARAAKLHAIYTDKSLSVAERERRASELLKGELPKLDLGEGPQDVTPEILATLKSHVMEHQNLLPYQKKRVVGALNKFHGGEVLQRNEITLLEHVFGKQVGSSLREGDKVSAWDNILRVANIPRSLMASFDVSAPMRQGLAAFARHPVISGKNYGPMFKALKSERTYQGMIDEIQNRPTYPLMQQAKLAITKLGSEVGPREERFPTDLAEKIPVAGRAVRGSGRAYTGYLDKTRADIFDHLLNVAQAGGKNVHDEKFLKDLGKHINNMTGRGSLGEGAIQEAGKFLNTLFFSPRLLASRVNILATPLTYARADPFVRKEAWKTWLGLAGGLTSFLALMSKVPGVTVVTDPRNPDWGKIKHGNTRIDVAGGFQQPLRLAAQLYTHTAISSTTGKKLNLTANGFGQPTRLDLLTRFFEGKEAPAPSLLTDWLRNSNQIGQKFSWKSELGSRFTPLLAQDVADLYRDRKGGVNGITAAFLGYGVGSFGVGLQTYGPPKPKAKAPSRSGGLYGGSGSTGSSGGGLYSGGSNGSSSSGGGLYSQSP